MLDKIIYFGLGGIAFMAVIEALYELGEIARVVHG